MKKPEILAPAGSWETLAAAAGAGADAVYLGGRSFNARRNAKNFTNGELKEALAFCRARGIRTYLTLNTLLFEDEMQKALEFVEFLCGEGVDAIILQDLGLLSLVRKAAPGMRLHASTQMSVHNIEGVLLLSKLGFSRVVLARELSKQEIARIREESPIELEVFVHGALCMSISGQCYMSAVLGGRSGNRGLCAQPCRLPFSVPGGTGHDLSLKDATLVDRIGELNEMGIDSLKIEGRMKRPEYVAAAVAACRKEVDGSALEPDELENLQSVFSRGGFTQGYYEKQLGRDMFGIRGREDVQASQSVLRSFRSLYEGTEKPRIKVRFHFSMYSGKHARLAAADDDGNKTVSFGKIPEKARTKETDKAFINEKLSKTGGTPFIAGEINSEIGAGLSLPVSEINRMRRETLDTLLFKRKLPHPISFSMPSFSTAGSEFVENPALRIRLRHLKQLTKKVAGTGAQLIYLPVSEISRNALKIKTLMESGVRIGAELPRAVFEDGQKSIQKDLEQVQAAGIQNILCGNLGGVQAALSRGLVCHGDFGLNVTNSHSADELDRLGVSSCLLSFETELSRLKNAASNCRQECGIIVYGRLPLMLTRNCPVRNGAGCSRCAGKIRDRRGGYFPVQCLGGTSEILNDRPLWLSDRKKELIGKGLHFIQLYFTTETPEQVDFALDSWNRGLPATGEFTRGLYYRGVE